MSFSYIHSSLPSFARLFFFQACSSIFEQYYESHLCQYQRQLRNSFQMAQPPLKDIWKENDYVQLGISHSQVIMSAAGATRLLVLHIWGTSAKT